VVGARRAVVAALVLIPLTLVGLAGANVAAFQSRAAGLEQAWNADQANGMTGAQLAPARASLRAVRARTVLFLPYAAFSFALFRDPFAGPEALAAPARAKALSEARQRAQDDLDRLHDVGGPNYVGYQSHADALAHAARLPDLVRLARAWEAEAQQLAGDRDELGSISGGLTGGLPKDVVDGVARIQSLISTAAQAQLWADPATGALTHAQAYLKLEYPDMLAQHDVLASEVRSAGDAVQHRVDTRTRADQLMVRAADLITQAAKYGVDASKVTQAQAAVQAAESARDDARMDGATAALKQAVSQLNAAVSAAEQRAYATALADDTACVPGAPAQLVVIRLATQKLVARNNGCPFLTTPVTTGRPALRTDQGTFTIHARYPSYLMHSPWQPSTNPLWYPDTVVHDAMLIVPADGTFIHSAEWEPASAYGPGSEDGPYASHGCVHVQGGPLATLYAWAQVGATVIVMN
jgi:lipoprotein-anchoring transpeptidase ErfK/SrfK